MKAILNNIRISPRKMRLVAGAVKGKKAEEAKAILSFMPKSAATPLLKLLKSAMANAENKYGKEEIKNLCVSGLSVDCGPVLKRSMPRARGMAFRIKKRTSRVTLNLSEKAK